MKQGRKTVFPLETEKKIAKAVQKMAELGFGPTLQELRFIVQDFVNVNDIASQFADGMPGYDWTVKFMDRHNLTLKKSGLMQLARKNVTSDPFVIYGFYDMLEAEVKRLGLENRPECIWNCDETGFPMDPSKFKTIGEKGKKAIRVTCGANRENITVLAVNCADGTALDPLIIFKGKNLQSTWHGNKALPKTFFAVSDNGWMTTTVFHAWFVKFLEETKSVRPLILLFDGHMTHTSIETIELARKENVSIIKLPAHCTDLLQPLDVSCFAPLKYYYEKTLLEHIQQTGGREPLKKAQFVNMLCSVWKHGLNATNIISGFKSTGVFPVDKTKYKLSCLDKIKLELYTAWKTKGSPLDLDGNPLLDFAKDIPKATEWSSDMPNDPQPSTSASSLPEGDSTDQSCTYLTTKQLIKLLQNKAPDGMKYEIRLVPKDENLTIESVIKSRGKSAVVNNGPPKKRKRVKMNGSILTNESFKDQVEKFDKENAPKQKKIKKKQIVSNTEEDEEIELHDESDYDEDGEDSDTSNAMEKDESYIQHSTISKLEVGKYFAVYWENPRTYYWGKLLKVFRDDIDGEPEKAEFKFLHKRSAIDGKVYWDWPTTEDIDIVDTANCFWGPAIAILTSGTRGRSYFVFEEENEVQEKFAFLQKYGLHNA